MGLLPMDKKSINRDLSQQKLSDSCGSKKNKEVEYDIKTARLQVLKHWHAPEKSGGHGEKP